MWEIYFSMYTIDNMIDIASDYKTIESMSTLITSATVGTFRLQGWLVIMLQNFIYYKFWHLESTPLPCLSRGVNICSKLTSIIIIVIHDV